MTKTDWKRLVLAENSLAEVVTFLWNSNDDKYYLDRHIVYSREDVPDEAIGDMEAVYEAAFELCEQWADEKHSVGRGLFFSGPLMIVDEEWIQGDENAPAPHVQMTLSKSFIVGENVLPSTAYKAAKCPESPLAEIAKEHGFTALRVDDIDDPEMGAWFFVQG